MLICNTVAPLRWLHITRERERERERERQFHQQNKIEFTRKIFVKLKKGANDDDWFRFEKWLFKCMDRFRLL
jgi:hypothetical protein